MISNNDQMVLSCDQMVSHIDHTILSIDQMISINDQMLLTMFIEDIISHRPNKLT